MSYVDSARCCSSLARVTSALARTTAASALLRSSSISGISRVAKSWPSFTRSPTSTLIFFTNPATFAITSTSWYGLNSAVRTKPCERSSVVTLATATVGTSAPLVLPACTGSRRAQEAHRYNVAIGKAIAKLSGTYNMHGESTSIHMKLDGEAMPVDDLEGLLPALGVKQLGRAS